jgi:cardiolipin synthase (CMP-forming)
VLRRGYLFLRDSEYTPGEPTSSRPTDRRTSTLRKACAVLLTIGRYHARDLLRVPGLLSLSRIPLAIAFPFVAGRPVVAFGVLIGAGVTDLLDGWYARRFNQVTATGAALDPVTDKLFVLTVAITLVVTKELSVMSILLLSAREIGELPLVLWLALSRDARSTQAEPLSTNEAGKVVTALQFATVGVVLVHVGHQAAWVGTTALAGAVASLMYWRRAVRSRRTPD